MSLYDFMVVSWDLMGFTLWFHQTWLENLLWMVVSIGKPSVNGPFSIAMFDYRRVTDSPFFFKAVMFRSFVDLPKCR